MTTPALPFIRDPAGCSTSCSPRWVTVLCAVTAALGEQPGADPVLPAHLRPCWCAAATPMIALGVATAASLGLAFTLPSPTA